MFIATSITVWLLLLATVQAFALDDHWTQCSGPYGGFVTSYVQRGNALYVSTSRDLSGHRGGIFKSSDGGETWTTIGRDYEGATSLAYKGTTLFATMENGGIHKTTNDGESWTFCDFEFIAGMPLYLHGSYLYTAIQGLGVHRSSDDGKTWEMMSNSDVAKTTFSLSFNGSMMYCPTQAAGVWKSSDAGRNWSQLGFPDKEVVSLSCVGNKIYVSLRFEGLFVSADTGATWTSLGLIDRGTQVVYAIDNMLFAGTNYGMFTSTDEGQTWTQNTNLPKYQTINAITTDATTSFCSNWGSGMYRSTDRGKSWVNCGVPTQLIGAMYAQDSVLLAGIVGDGYGVARSTNLGRTWDEVDSQLPGQNIRAFAAQGQTIYMVSVYDVYKSVDTGHSWQPLNTGLNERYITKLFDILVKDTLLFCCMYEAGVARSSDSGKTWEQCINGLENMNTRTIYTMGSSLMLGCTNGQIFRSDDNGNSWFDVSPGSLTNEIRSMASIGSTLFIGSEGDGVYSTTNAGTTWQVAYGDLPNWQVNDMAVIDSTLYVGTQAGGVWRTTDKGTHWTSLNKGLHNLVVYRLLAHNQSLYAGTIGSSIYATTVSSTHTEVEEESVVAHQFRLSPNPSTTQTHFEFECMSAQKFDLIIIDAAANIVQRSDYIATTGGSQSLSLSTKDLCSGAYTVLVHTSSSSIALPLVVHK